jgi:hypothetical protein
MTDLEKGIIKRECARKSLLEDTENSSDTSLPAIHSNELDVRDVILSFRISRSLAERIERYRITKRRKRKTEAVIELLEVGVFVAEQADKLRDPVLVRYLQDNLYNLQLVDDMMEWPQDRIDAILGALASEKERRLRIKLGRST